MSNKTANTVSTSRNANKGNTMSKNANSAYNSLQTRQRKFIDTLVGLFGAGDGNFNYTRTQVLTAATKCGMSCAPVWITNNADRRAGRGLYAVPETASASATDNGKPTKTPAPKPVVQTGAVAAAVTEATSEPRAVAALITEVQNFIPEVNPIYLPWCNFSPLRTIIKSKVF